MDASIKDIIKSLPDFDDLTKLVNEIGELSVKKLKLEAEVKAKETDIMRTALTSETYFVGGKAPSVAYVESVYKFTGFNGELLPIRDSLADVAGELEKRRLLLYVYKDMLELYRTMSANERTSAI